jgi:hypothetical protein
MKKLILVLLLLVSYTSKAQNLEAAAQTYVSFSPCLTNELGSFRTKLSPTIEVGRQFQDVFTLGLALGKTNCANKSLDDIYLEVRPNLNVFQVGKFTNTITPGVGYVFGPIPSLMLEWTSGVEYEFTENIHMNVFFGNYYYSSFNSDVNAPSHFSPCFWGFSVVKFFKPTKLKSLIKVK